MSELTVILGTISLMLLSIGLVLKWRLGRNVEPVGGLDER